MEPLTWFIVTFAFLLAVFYVQEKYSARGRLKSLINQIPGPKSYPFVGTSLPFLFLKREEFFGYIRGLTKNYGPIFRTWRGNQALVHLTTADYVEVILNNSVHISKSSTYSNLHAWLGDGLLTSTGEKWHRHRKLLTPTFHFTILENFMEVFVEKSEMLANLLSSKVNGEIFDIYPYITRCALDIICETAMGIQVNAMLDEDNQYVQAVYGMCEVTVQRSVKPWLHSDLVFFNTEHGRKFRNYLSVLHNTTNRVIDERKQTLLNKAKENDVKEEVCGKKQRMAFLDLLLEVAQDGAVLSHEQIREEVDTFMFEGHDTTTAGICWSLYLLGLHQDVQDEVYKEIKTTFSDKKNLTLNDLGNLKLLERVIKESLRLYPSVVGVGRMTAREVKIGDFLIPAGCDIAIQIYDIHRNPKYYPDPDRFDPDRFLPENSKNRHPYAFIPFSAGPRNCIGQRFAMFEEKTVLAHILNKYRVVSVQSLEDVRPFSELILRPYEGLFVKLENRE